MSAAARANSALGVLESRKAEAIVRACTLIRGGALHDQFVVDELQGGAGTSTNINANEVIANLDLTLSIALRKLGMRVSVYEQATELAEIGAAVALSANSIRLLRHLGLEDALAAVSAEPTELQFRRWDSGDLIWSHRMGGVV